MQPSGIPSPTLAGRWAGQLQDKVDDYESQLRGDLSEADQQYLNDLPEADQHHKDVSPSQTPKRHAIWHKRPSTKSWQPGHIVSSSKVESPKLAEVLRKRTSEVPVKQRTVGRLRHLRMRLLVNVAHRIINLLTKADELIIKVFHGNSNEKVSHDFPRPQRTIRKQSILKRFFAGKGKPQPELVERDSLEQVTKRPDVIERLIQKDKASTQRVRQSALGPVIAENTEDLVGVVYPGGIPYEELQLYTNPRLVVIKGGATNEYGHALLAFGDSQSGDDRYVQISSANWYPEHLDGSQFKEYLSKWGNEIAYEVHLGCKDEEKMRDKLAELSSTRWLWGGPLHNCMTFCKVIGDAGGASEDLYKGLTTISNRVSTNVLQGFQTGMFMAVLDLKSNYSPEGREQTEPTDMQNKLGRFEELMAEKVSEIPNGKTVESLFVNELTRTEYMEKIFSEIPGCLEEAGIPDELHSEMQQQIESVCRREVLISIERGDQDFHEFDVRDLADLPLASAYNAPVNHRVVGPQSLTEAFKDPEDSKKDDVPHMQLPIYRVVNGGHLDGFIDKLSEAEPAHEKELLHFHAQYRRALLESEHITVYAKGVQNPDNIDEETNKPVVSPENIIWKWPEITPRMSRNSQKAMVEIMDRTLKDSSLPESLKASIKAKLDELVEMAITDDLPDEAIFHSDESQLLRDIYPFTRTTALTKIFAPYKSAHETHLEEFERLHTEVSALISELRIQLALNPFDRNNSDLFVMVLFQIKELFAESKLPEALRNEVGVAVINRLKKDRGPIDFDSALKRYQGWQTVKRNNVAIDPLKLSVTRDSVQVREWRQKANESLIAARRQELRDSQGGFIHHSTELGTDDDPVLQPMEWASEVGNKTSSAATAYSDRDKTGVLQSPLFRKCFSIAVGEYPDYSEILKPMWTAIGNEFIDLELAYLMNKPEAEKEKASKALIKSIEKRLMLTDLPSNVVESFSIELVDLFRLAAPDELKPLKRELFSRGKKVKLDTPPELSDSFGTLTRRKTPEVTREDLLRRRSWQFKSG